MPVLISLLRGVNLGGYNKINMTELRELYRRLRLGNAQTHVQSGNVVFTSEERDLRGLATKIENAIERSFGFRPAVIIRTASELKEVVARNPFAMDSGLSPSKLLVTFLANDIGEEMRKKLLSIKTSEDIRCGKRELYIYFPEGVGRSKLFSGLDKLSNGTGTSRNWNTVLKLVDISEKLKAVE